MLFYNDETNKLKNVQQQGLKIKSLTFMDIDNFFKITILYFFMKGLIIHLLDNPNLHSIFILFCTLDYFFVFALYF